MKLLSFFGNKKFNSKVNDNSNSAQAEFVRDMSEKGIGLKSSLMEYVALNKGLKVKRLSKRVILIETKSGNSFAFHNMNGINSSRVGMNLCNTKQDTRYLLNKKKIAVIESRVFKFTELDKAKEYINKIGFPIVVKPTHLSRGRGITTNIGNDKEFEIAWDNAFSAYRSKNHQKNVIIERHFNGEDYRVFVIDNKVVSVTQRKRPNVMGDGKSTIIELIKSKNAERRKNPYLCNHLIPEDYSLLDLLIKQEYKLNDVLSEGKEIILRSQSNISAGGDSVDLTHTIHKGFKDIAIKALNTVPGIRYAGIDIIAPDISVKPSKSNYILSEIEYSPAPLAQFPYNGISHDIANEILKFYLKNNK